MSRLKKISGLAVFLAGLCGAGYGYSADVPGNIPVCYDFSCKTSALVQFTEQDWDQVKGLFYQNTDAAQERRRLRQAIAVMEKIVGTYTPTYRDVGLNWPPGRRSVGSDSGQMDCIDESINTTTYLNLLASAGLLKFHKVLDRAYRRSLFSQHWAAQIVETGTDQHYVVDSWFRKNGEPPIMVRGEVWHDLSLF